MATKKAAPAPKSAPAKGKAKETAKAKDTKATKKAAAKPAPKKVAKPVVPSMTKTALVDRLAKKAQIKPAVAKAVLDELVVVAAEESKNGFMLPGLGKFVFREVKERQGRHPGTGEPITIPGGQKLKFVISETIKKAVQG